MSGLSWSKAALDELWACVHAAAPREAVGALVGRPGHVVMVVELENTAPGNDHYSVDPRELVSLFAHVREWDGLEVLGYWHSHPHSSSEPSALDRELALPEVAYVIASLRDGDLTEFSA